MATTNNSTQLKVWKKWYREGRNSVSKAAIRHESERYYPYGRGDPAGQHIWPPLHGQVE